MTMVLSGDGTVTGLGTQSQGVVGYEAGEVCFFARSTAPTGFLKCNGTAVSRTTYSALFAAISTTFGIGDGSTTFNVPELRGEFIRGLDDSRGIDSARALGSAQTDQLQSHLHPFTALVSQTGGGVGTTTPSVNSANFTGVTSAPSVDGANGTPRVGTETRPRNVALLACIRY